MNRLNRLSEFLDRFSNMLIDLHFISHRALFDRSLNEKLTIAKSITPDKAVKVLEKENAWKKNLERKENVYFSFSKDNETFNIAFVDDIQKIDEFRRKNHFLLVQTSEKKYQAYFKLSRPVSIFEIYRIQKALCYVYKGDVGALSPLQLKRVVGFYNTKYNPPFSVQEVFRGSAVLDVDKVLAFYKKHFEKTSNDNAYSRPKSQTKGIPLKKSWNDFEDTDLSVADMRYACYLVRMGLSDEEIAERLLAESPDIQSRKRNINDYLRRTIQKARQYVR